MTQSKSIGRPTKKLKTAFALNGPWPLPKTQLETEELWAGRVKAARLTYNLAEARLRQVIAGQEKWPLPEPDASTSIHAARLQELDARSEYLQSLNIFVELLVFGELAE